MPASSTDFYDPNKTFDDNFDNGPYPSLHISAEAATVKNDQAYAFLGYALNSPFGIPAGPLPTSRHVDYAFKRGFDVVCYKTQRSVEFPANKFPNIVYLDVEGDLTLDKASRPIVGHTKNTFDSSHITITNSFGNPSRGPGYWIKDLTKAVRMQSKGQLLIASIVGTIKQDFTAEDYFNDFVETASMALETGVSAIEVNLSCPNVANEGILCYSPESVLTICRRVKERIGKTPLIAKIGYFSPDQENMLEQILKANDAYVDAFSAINTIPVPVVDEEGKQLLPGEGRLKSGACGSSIKWAGLDMVRRLTALREKNGLTYEIVGVGGVMSAEDFREYRNTGATIVQSATGAMWNPNLAKQIKDSL